MQLTEQQILEHMSRYWEHQWHDGDQYQVRISREQLATGIAALSQPVQAEPAAPHIVEALSWHANERDDLTLDDAVDVIRHGWKSVHGRTERQLTLQIASLLAAAPQAAAIQPKAQDEHPLSALHINQGSFDAAADAYEAEYVEHHARLAYDNTYHKIRAEVAYDTWLKIWRKAWAALSSTVSDKDAQDAARYQFIRRYIVDVTNIEVKYVKVWPEGKVYTRLGGMGRMLDDAIDAEMRQQAGEKS